MAAPKPLYDLMLLLDLSATDDVRAKLVDETRATIERSGELVGHHPWGQRALAYPIRHQEAAEYHLFQLHGPADLLSSLDRTLRIADGVLRHRIVKLAPGTPPPPSAAPHVAAEEPAAETDSPPHAAAEEPAAETDTAVAQDAPAEELEATQPA